MTGYVEFGTPSKARVTVTREKGSEGYERFRVVVAKGREMLYSDAVRGLPVVDLNGKRTLRVFGSREANIEVSRDVERQLLELAKQSKAADRETWLASDEGQRDIKADEYRRGMLESGEGFNPFVEQ